LCLSSVSALFSHVQLAMLQPGQHIRPQLSQQMALSLVQRLYGYRDISIVELNGYDDRNYHVQVSQEMSTVHWVVTG